MKISNEKFVLGELALTCLIFIYYLYLTFISELSGSLFSIYFTIVILYTLLVTILVLIMLLVNRSKGIENDERDNIIRAKAYRNGFLTAIVIINTLLFWILLNNKVLDSFIMFNILFSTLFVIQIIQNITQLFYYKRGV